MTLLDTRAPTIQGKHKHFRMAYYPQARAKLGAPVPSDLGSVRSRRGTETHVNRRLLVSCQVPISKTSKSSVVRNRIKRRVLSAFSSGLLKLGPEMVPDEPMHVLLNVSLSCLLAPFIELQADAMDLYQACRDRHTAKLRQKKGNQSGQPSRQQGQARRAKDNKATQNGGDTNSRQNQFVPKLQPSAYLDSHGGAHALITKVLNSSNVMPRTAQISDSLRRA